MIQKKSLILKPESNEFEKYYSDKMREHGIDVFSVFPKSLKLNIWAWRILSIVDRVVPVFPRLYGKDWREKVRQCSDIIVFDTEASVQLFQYIKKVNPECNIRLWMWNVRDDLSSKLLSYCRVYSFDKEYCKKNKNAVYLQQFYFKQEKVENNNIISAFFVGINKGRDKELKAVSDVLEKEGICHKFIIYDENVKPSTRGIIYTTTYMSYLEIIKAIEKSTCIVEIVSEGQVGLTVRALEALFFSRKLITNNKDIRNYTFYDPNNIFIWGIDDLSKIGQFIKSPFRPVKEETKYSCSFEKWYSDIMED